VRGSKASFGCALVLVASAVASAEGPTSAQSRNWSANFVARVEALALLETLNSELLSNNSATLTLEHWVQELHFQRRRLSSKLLWRPLPEGWEMNSASPDTAVVPMPANLLEHRAVLTLPDGTPFSEVVESYTANVLGFALPRP
jgi:hypothetical protein